MSSSTNSEASDKKEGHQLKMFSHKFWSPELAQHRNKYLKMISIIIALVIVTEWTCLSLYWGSLAHEKSYTNKLRSYLVNRDGSTIGNAIQDAIVAQVSSTPKMRLGWEVVDPIQFAKDDAVTHAVVEEKAWLAVVIQAGATQRLMDARANGDPSYNASEVVRVFYSQARNMLASGDILLPYSQAVLMPAISMLNAKLAAEYLTSIAQNQTALTALARSPQTISGPVATTMIDLRPFDSTVATALLVVGSIYLIIFTFIPATTGYILRQSFEPYLSTGELLKLRVIAPVIFYIPLSFSFAMIALPFKTPFGAKYGYGAGFFLYWTFTYLTMLAVGLATEAMVTMLTPMFITFFLVPLIIINVSVESLPIALQPWFYKYGYGFPVHNYGQAIRTLIFDTKNYMARNAGVLLGWIGLSLITLPFFAFIFRWRHMKAHSREHKDSTNSKNSSA